MSGSVLHFLSCERNEFSGSNVRLIDTLDLVLGQMLEMDREKNNHTYRKCLSDLFLMGYVPGDTSLMRRHITFWQLIVTTDALNQY